MMKFNFNSIFSKNIKPTFQNHNYQNHSYQNHSDQNQDDDEDIPHFIISENCSMKNDYEVAEISYEEFKKTAIQDRRKVAREKGQIRKAYYTKQS